MNSRTRLLIMLPVLAVAAWLALFADKTPEGGAEIVSPVVASAGRSVPAAGLPAQDTLPEAVSEPENPAITGIAESSQILRLRDRSAFFALLQEEQVDLFGGGAPGDSSSQEDATEQPEAPSQAFNLIGRMYDRDHWVVFLERDARTHVARARDVVEGFRIDMVNDREIRMTHLADKTKSVIQIDGDKKDPAHD